MNLPSEYERGEWNIDKLAWHAEIDPATCALLGPFALLVQATMGLLVIGSLLLKRAREKPKRRWSVWSADVSKQITGQAFVHASNLLISGTHSTKFPVDSTLWTDC